jgi:hypothetical protein
MTLIADTAETMDETERRLLLAYLDGHRTYAEVNGRRFEVLYASHHIGDPMPWIAVAAPEIQFPSTAITVGEASRRA